MSNFSHALQSEIDASGQRQSDWAALSGLSQAIISRYCAGISTPDRASMDRLCAALPPATAHRLITAHLADETPPSARDHIVVITNPIPIRQPSPGHADIDALDAPTKKSILHIARLALTNPAAADALQSMARYLGCPI
jgi:hypothetical protein